MTLSIHDSPATESSSSMKMMAGAASLARWNARRSCASPSPTYMECSCAPDSARKVAAVAPAAARASVVLQQPAQESLSHQTDAAAGSSLEGGRLTGDFVISNSMLPQPASKLQVCDFAKTLCLNTRQVGRQHAPGRRHAKALKIAQTSKQMRIVLSCWSYLKSTVWDTGTWRAVQQHAARRGEAQALEGGRVGEGPLHRLPQPPLHVLQPADVFPADCRQSTPAKGCGTGGVRATLSSQIQQPVCQSWA